MDNETPLPVRPARRFQFSLATLLVATTAIALSVGTSQYIMEDSGGWDWCYLAVILACAVLAPFWGFKADPTSPAVAFVSLLAATWIVVAVAGFLPLTADNARWHERFLVLGYPIPSVAFLVTVAVRLRQSALLVGCLTGWLLTTSFAAGILRSQVGPPLSEITATLSFSAALAVGAGGMLVVIVELFAGERPRFALSAAAMLNLAPLAIIGGGLAYIAALGVFLAFVGWKDGTGR